MENQNRSKKDEAALQALREMINFYDTRHFYVHRYKDVVDPELVIIDAYICICHEKTTKVQKEAAYELLKRLVKEDTLDNWLEGSATVCDRNDRYVLHWKRAVVKHGKCEKCGRTEHLEAHHKIPWAIYPKGRINLNNGACLCDECHAEEHKDQLPYAMMMSRIRKRQAVGSG